MVTRADIARELQRRGVAILPQASGVPDAGGEPAPAPQGPTRQDVLAELQRRGVQVAETSEAGQVRAGTLTPAYQTVPLSQRFAQVPEGVVQAESERFEQVMPRARTIGRHAIPTLTTAGGTMLGGPVGGAVGAGVGTAINQALGLEEADPWDIPVHAVLTGASGAAAGVLGKALAMPGAKKGAQWALRTFGEGVRFGGWSSMFANPSLEGIARGLLGEMFRATARSKVARQAAGALLEKTGNVITPTVAELVVSVSRVGTSPQAAAVQPGEEQRLAPPVPGP